MLSIVVPAYKDDEGLYLTLASASEQARAHGIEHELIVVIDSGTALRPDKSFPNCRMVSGRYGSPAKARDAGLQQAKGEWALVLDSHLGLQYDLLPGLLTLAERLPNAGLISAVQRSSLVIANRDTLFYELEINWQPPKIWYRRNWDTPAASEPYQLGFANLACHLLRLDAYRGVRHMVADLPYGAEEIVLSGALWLNGYTVWMAPGLHFYHYFGQRRAPADMDHVRNDRLILERLDLAAVRTKLEQAQVARI